MAGSLASLREKFRWHANEFLIRRPAWLARLGMPLTLVDQFGTPGDTLLTAIVCRELKQQHPGLRINCVTPNPSLLQHDPNIDSLNAPPTFSSINFQYLEVIDRKDGSTNLLAPTLNKLGIRDYDYQARVFLTDEEIAWAQQKLGDLPQPVITINVMSRETVKNWREDCWRDLIGKLRCVATVVQLGDDKEPILADVVRLAGLCSLRESMALLSQATLHIGGVSFLMHAASGLAVPAVIIFGGRETPKNSGYDANTNIYSPVECSPCWLHDSHGDRCPHDMKCMQMILPEAVWGAVQERLALRTV